MKKKFTIIARCVSKYGTTLYLTDKVNGFDLDNVYITTAYYKGGVDYKAGDTAEFTLIKGENGYIYAI